MKVTTEGCILGAWVTPPAAPSRILDIGSGTGLLALMLAQRYNCPIDAVEIDEGAAEQARENFRNSPWHNRLKLFHQNITTYSPAKEGGYDLIVCNPPFFQANMQTANKAKNIAIHDDLLPQSTLLSHIKRLLSPIGTAYVLYPEFESNRFQHLAKELQLHASDALIIKNKAAKSPFRKVSRLSLHPTQEIMPTDELIIRDADNSFNPIFTQLLTPYYQHL